MYEDFEDEGFDQVPDSVNRAIEAWQHMMMRKLVEDNFTKLATKGFSLQQIREWDQEEIEVLIETFNYMINEFEEDEAYEKCAVLVKARESLIERKPFQPVNI